MKTVKTILFSLMFFSITLVSAQNKPDTSGLIRVKALMNLAVDHYVLVFNVIQVAESLEGVQKLYDSRTTKFLSELMKLGIEKKAVKTELIKLIPVYSNYRHFSASNIQVPAGFEAHYNISVLCSNALLIDKIVYSATRSEIYELIKINCYSDKTEQAIDSLRKICVQKAISKSKDLAVKGVKFDDPKAGFSEKFQTFYPALQYTDYNNRYGYSFPLHTYWNKKMKRSCKHKRDKVSYASVRDLNTYTDERVCGYFSSYSVPSKYYDPLNYTDFDIIINPIITEPVIQIVFSMTFLYP